MLVADKNITEQKPKTLVEGILDYINILLRYKILIIIVTVLAAIGSITFAAISIVLPAEESPLPNKYKSHAILMLREQESGGLSSILYTLGLESPNAGRGRTNNSMLAIRIFNTRTFLTKLVEKFNIIEKYGIPPEDKSKQREAIADRTDIRYDRNINTLVIEYEDIDPVFATNMANAIAVNLLEWFESKGGTTKMNQKLRLEEKMAEVNEEITNLESRILIFQQKHGFLSVEDLAIAQSNLINGLKSQLVLKELEIKNYSEFVKIEDPSLRRMKAERNNILDLIKQVEEGYSTSGQKAMPAIAELPKLSLEFTNLTTNLQIQMRIYETLSQQYEVTKLTIEADPVFQILEEAAVPDEKSGPQRAMLCIIIIIAAVFMSCGLALGLNFLKSIKTMSNKKSKNKAQKQEQKPEPEVTEKEHETE